MAMSFSFHHETLRSTLTGVELASVVQYRGIPYGRIPARFAAPEPAEALPADLDCTEFGPRCPQVPIDVGHLLRIPPDIVLPTEPEDESACLNLDVVVPKEQPPSSTTKSPVMVWIHGGSQAVTFGSAASGVCDTTAIVAASHGLGKPIVAVSVQYRLNIFALGDANGPRNLALKDQSIALEWVQNHISGFGGDPDNVTVAGESAGAVYCHAHLVLKSPARQYILSSGSLFLSPPQSTTSASFLRDAVRKQLQALGSEDLTSAPVPQIIEAMKRSGIQSWFLQMDESLQNWQNTTGNAQRLLISDVQKESAIWQAGVYTTETHAVVAAFDLAGEHSSELKKLYHIHHDRPSSSRNGALDFINDYKFVLPVENIVRQWAHANKPIFRCLIDELNPWQLSSGAHHAVDLILLFGGFDSALPSASQHTGMTMREKWISFLHLDEPWPSDSYYAFGPHGGCQVLDDSSVRSRRRVVQVEYLNKLDQAVLNRVFLALASGKLSLRN